MAFMAGFCYFAARLAAVLEAILGASRNRQEVPAGGWLE